MISNHNIKFVWIINGSFTFVKNIPNDIFSSIIRLNIIHSSMISPSDLIKSIRFISQTLQRNSLTPVCWAHFAQLIDIIELQVYLRHRRITFVFNILSDIYVYLIYLITNSDNRHDNKSLSYFINHEQIHRNKW